LALVLGFGGSKPAGKDAVKITGTLFNSWIHLTPFLYQTTDMSARGRLVVQTIANVIKEFTGTQPRSQGETHKTNRLEVIDIILKFQLHNPVSETKKEKKEDKKGVERKLLYAEISFDVALKVLETCPNFILQNIESSLSFIDIAILRSVLYSAYSHDIRGRLVDILFDAFKEEVKLLPETTEEKALKRTKLQKLQDEESYVSKRLNLIQPQLEKLLKLLLDSKQRPTEKVSDKQPWGWLLRADSNDLNAIRKSAGYTNIAALTALDLIVKLGDETKQKIQVKDKVVEVKKAVKKEVKKGKESKNKKDQSKDKDIKAEAPKEEKQVEKKVEKKESEEENEEEKVPEKKEEFSPNRTVWRKLFEDYLIQFQKHPDSQVRSQAYYVVPSKPIVSVGTVKKKAAPAKAKDVQNKKRR